ncbi:MAG: hypothetical protein E7157_05765 [Lactobacillales bacterium]|nr:hypothetical protein [Lactobacillales bacterium]
MNRSYMYANGNIHIFSDKIDKDVIEYVDKFEERLISQNKLEVYQKMISMNEQDMDKLDVSMKKDSFQYTIRNISYLTVGTVIPMFINHFCKLDFSYLDITLENFIFVSTLISLALGNIREIPFFKKYLEEAINYYAREKCKPLFQEIYDNEKTTYDELCLIKTKDEEEIYKERKLQVIDLDSEQIENEALLDLVEKTEEQFCKKKVRR